MDSPEFTECGKLRVGVRGFRTAGTEVQLKSGENLAYGFQPNEAKMMIRICWSMALAIILLLNARAVVTAQAVQLPQTRQFWTTGSALVPDRGGASLAGSEW